MKTKHLGLPYIVSGQAQKHITHNEALSLLDTFIQLSVKSSVQTAPPTELEEGDRYIVGAEASLEWATKDNQIAVWEAGNWYFHQPQKGWICWDQDDNALLIYTGVQWSNLSMGDTASAVVACLGINGQANDINRLTVRSAYSLFDHDGAGHQLKLNKANSADVCSLVFQTDYQGVSEFGLFENNMPGFKVATAEAPNDWNFVWRVDPENGNLAIGEHSPNVPLDIKRDYEPQLRLSPIGGEETTSGKSSTIDFWGTFDNFPSDQGPRRCASIRGGFNGGIWGNEFLSFHVGGAGDSGDIPIERMRIHGSGKVGIGVASPTAELHVDGVIRCGAHTVDTLPSAANVGVGAFVMALTSGRGDVPVYSDGTQWRYVSDNAIV